MIYIQNFFLLKELDMYLLATIKPETVICCFSGNRDTEMNILYQHKLYVCKWLTFTRLCLVCNSSEALHLPHKRVLAAVMLK